MVPAACLFLDHVIFFVAQSLIQLLHSEGVELWDVPNPPVDRRKLPKGRKPIKVDETADWSDYV